MAKFIKLTAIGNVYQDDNNYRWKPFGVPVYINASLIKYFYYQHSCSRPRTVVVVKDVGSEALEHLISDEANKENEQNSDGEFIDKNNTVLFVSQSPEEIMAQLEGI